jgi:hypothetical protein
VEGVREQAALAVADRDARLITGGFDAEDPHPPSITSPCAGPLTSRRWPAPGPLKEAPGAFAIPQGRG